MNNLKWLVSIDGDFWTVDEEYENKKIFKCSLSDHVDKRKNAFKKASNHIDNLKENLKIEDDAVLDCYLNFFNKKFKII